MEIQIMMLAICFWGVIVFAFGSGLGIGLKSKALGCVCGILVFLFTVFAGIAIIEIGALHKTTLIAKQD